MLINQTQEYNLVINKRMSNMKSRTGIAANSNLSGWSIKTPVDMSSLEGDVNSSPNLQETFIRVKK